MKALPGVETVVYEDLGISEAMKLGIHRARLQRRTIEFRSLGEGWLERETKLAESHSHASIWGQQKSD